MSIRVTSRVWEYSQQQGSRLLAILAIADHADDDGVAWPGIPRVARKVRVDDRQAQRIVRQLTAAGELFVREGRGRANTNLYFVVIGLDAQTIHDTLVARFEMTPLEAAVAVQNVLKKQERARVGEKKGGADVTFSAEKGGVDTTFSLPPPAEKGGAQTTFSGQKGDIFDRKGDIAMSPESSCNHVHDVDDSHVSKLCRSGSKSPGLESGDPPSPENRTQKSRPVAALLAELAGILVSGGMALPGAEAKAMELLQLPGGIEVCRRQMAAFEQRCEQARASKRGLANPIGLLCKSIAEDWPLPAESNGPGKARKRWCTDEEFELFFDHTGDPRFGEETCQPKA
jgi:hypothetical protein